MNISGWAVGEHLGRGGNGTVHQAAKGCVIGAMKVLNSRSAARVVRFRDEVEALRKCGDIPGVLPVLDDDLEPLDGSAPWFVMGLALPIQKKLGAEPKLALVCESMRDVGLVLLAMHERDLSHRDIKPENLFFYEGRWAVGDFRLAKFEGKWAKTEVGERIGPVHYIAPEMLNDAPGSDGRCADVYSLAKTLWVLATGQRFPLPGHYQPTIAAFRLSSYINEERTTSLDKLIAAATTFEPSERPKTHQMVAELAAWLAPEPTAALGFRVDTSRFTVQLERRKIEAEAEREREHSQQQAQRDAGIRLRESFRTFAEEISGALVEGSFDPVILNMDNYTWGFEIRASVPALSGADAVFRLILNVDVSSLSAVHVTATMLVEILKPTAFNALLWDKSVKFLEGGSEELACLHQLRARVHRELQPAVTKALEMALGDQASADEARPYAFLVKDSEGAVISNADVLLVASDGIYSRQTTDKNGSAIFSPTPMIEAIAFVTHAKYKGALVSKLAAFNELVLHDGDGGGSMALTRGGSSVPGLMGEVQLIHDSSRRMYVYAANTAVNDGQQQPVHFQLAETVRFKGLDGMTVHMTARAVRGACFLVDLTTAGGPT